MTLPEFESAVEVAKIPKMAFSTSDADGWDTYGIGVRSNGWELYYSERGERRPIKFYPDEEKALDGLYSYLIVGFTHHFPEFQISNDIKFRLLRCPGCKCSLRIPFEATHVRVCCPKCDVKFTYNANYNTA